MGRDTKRGVHVRAKEGFAIAGVFAPRGEFAPRITMDGGTGAAVLLGALAIVASAVVAIVALRSRGGVAAQAPAGSAADG